jgi:hypothetical protein
VHGIQPALVRGRPVLRDEAVPPVLEHRRDGPASVITDESDSVAGAVKAVFSPLLLVARGAGQQPTWSTGLGKEHRHEQ